MSHAAARCPNCFTEAPADPCRHCGWRAGDTTPAPYLPVGTLFDGGYRIGRVLGHGGFGITYLGWDENLDLKLAIKEYLPRDLGGRAGPGATVSAYGGEARQWFGHGLERFQDEARTLAKFQQHPGIVSVYNFFRTNGTGYMVMEYVEGFTLKSYLEKKGLLSYRSTRRALLPVMDALRAVHAEGLLHRDVSPDNIYINQQRQVKLLDFGAARFAASEHSRSLSVVLKPGFAPVEQYSSRGKQGPWTDVYSLAATFYYCITGEMPPEAMDRLEEDGLRRPSQLGVEIPPAAEAMLLAGLAVRAKDRPQSMAAFQQVFLQEGATTPTQTAPRSASAQPAADWTAASVTQAEPSTVKPSRPAPGRPANWPARTRKTGLGLGTILGTVGVLVILVLLVALSKATRQPVIADTSQPRAAPEPVHSPAPPVSPPTVAKIEPSDPQTQFELGKKYFNGDGVAQSDAEAVKWFRKAADQGDAAAQFSLGFVYREGRGVAQSDAEAVRWYRLAADQGDASAQNNLGVMYDNGRGVAQSDAEAVKWFRKATDQGNAGAQNNLGNMYANGRGVAQSDAEAVRWYRLAADQGDAEAQFNLGLMYAKGQGVAQSDAEAVRWYRLAADQGSASAQTGLGIMYENGRGVAQSDAEAVRWWRLAADQGDEHAMYGVGEMYEQGRGVRRDAKEAKKWFTEAEKKGVTHASMLESCRKFAAEGIASQQYWLGVMLSEGRGVARDNAEARKWLEMAMQQGYPAAKDALKKLGKAK